MTLKVGKCTCVSIYAYTNTHRKSKMAICNHHTSCPLDVCLVWWSTGDEKSLMSFTTLGILIEIRWCSNLHVKQITFCPLSGSRERSQERDWEWKSYAQNCREGGRATTSRNTEAGQTMGGTEGETKHSRKHYLQADTGTIEPWCRQSNFQNLPSYLVTSILLLKFFMVNINFCYVS